MSRADVLDGKPLGDIGAYEKLVGKVCFALDPDAAANKLIVDLDNAPRNDKGEVEFVSDFYILRPKEAAHASGSVLLEIPNRGGKGILAIMQGGKGSRDPKTEEDFGDGFLMRRGVTVAWLGWQWDVRDDTNRMRPESPRALEAVFDVRRSRPVLGNGAAGRIPQRDNQASVPDAPGDGLGRTAQARRSAVPTNVVGRIQTAMVS
jgi:hypothetical protein